MRNKNLSKRISLFIILIFLIFPINIIAENKDFGLKSEIGNSSEEVIQSEDAGNSEELRQHPQTTGLAGQEYEVKFISNKIGATKEEVVETRTITVKVPR